MHAANMSIMGGGGENSVHTATAVHLTFKLHDIHSHVQFTVTL